MFNLDHIVIVLFAFAPLFITILPTLLLAGAIAFHRRLLARFKFPLFTRYFYWAVAAISAVPTLLDLAYNTPCRHLDDLPLPWIKLIAFLCIAIVLGLYNYRRTNLANGLAAMLIQVLILALALTAGSAPVEFLSAMASMHSKGSSGEWQCLLFK